MILDTHVTASLLANGLFNEGEKYPVVAQAVALVDAGAASPRLATLTTVTVAAYNNRGFATVGFYRALGALMAEMGTMPASAPERRAVAVLAGSARGRDLALAKKIDPRGTIAPEAPVAPAALTA